LTNNAIDLIFDKKTNRNTMNHLLFWKRASLLFAFAVLSIPFTLQAPPAKNALSSDPTAKEIVAAADKRTRGETSQGEMKMTITRPAWTREVRMKTWSKGDRFALILITAPARDRGAAFLKRDKEIWNWQPTIDRVIKLPPSMMMQSWMGSDFTNDDLVRQSSIVEDFTHTIAGKERIEGRDCYKIQLIPKDNAAVVWGKILMWIDQKDYLQLKTEFFDEDGYLVNTMHGKQVRMMGGKLIPTVLEVIPVDQPNQRTTVEYLSLEFDKPIHNDFFSVQNMKRVR
jgi:outer membrane lipoprotein-sorting protein